jgi:hypothetical protein
VDASAAAAEVGQTEAEVGETEAEVGQTGAEVGQTGAEVGQTGAEVGETETAVGETEAGQGQCESSGCQIHGREAGPHQSLAFQEQKSETLETVAQLGHLGTQCVSWDFAHQLAERRTAVVCTGEVAFGRQKKEMSGAAVLGKGEAERKDFSSCRT